MANSLVGQTLGHYKILDQLGAGGMGVVYRAQDSKLGRQVALKVLPTGNTASEEAVERFRREARTASSLNHQNICTIYGFDEHEGQLYLAMELLDGEPLDRRLAGRPLELKQMLDIATQVADALDAAHAEGILHRDIKPANIKLTPDGFIKLVDFGLVKLMAHDESRTITVIQGRGTAAYTPLEQYGGDTGHTDARSDIYSLGGTLYHLLTNQPPPDAKQRFLRPDALTPPRAVNPTLSLRTERAILAALAMHPEDRPLHATAFRDMLIAGPIDAPGTIRRETPLQQTTRAFRTHRRVAFGVSAMIVLALLVTLFAEPIKESPTAAPTPTTTATPR